jgi:enoyl-CoA hydratase/carnithine racemase
VLVSREGDLLRLTLNRPERRNAFGRGVRDGLVSALEVARIDDAVSVVIEGRGLAFSSGGDLAEFGTAPDPATAHLVRIRHGAGLVLDELQARTTVRIHGACIGAGIEVPAFCGTVIAAPDTRIGLPEIAMGLVPGAGGTVSITRRIGRWRTAWLALTGERLDPWHAQRWGLVDQVA